MSPQDLLNPRPFFADLKNRDADLWSPLRMALMVVLLGTLIPVMFYDFAGKGQWFVRQVFFGLVGLIVVIALVRLIAGLSSNVRAPEVVGYSLTPILYALLVFGTLGFFVPLVGPLVMILGLGLTIYSVFTGVDVMVGRAEAWRVVLIVPVLAVVVLSVFGALGGAPMIPASPRP